MKRGARASAGKFLLELHFTIAILAHRKYNGYSKKSQLHRENCMIEQLQNIESAAKALSLNPWTIRAYIRQGKIRPVRIGRRVLIEPGEIRRIIDLGRDYEPEWGPGHRTGR